MGLFSREGSKLAEYIEGKPEYGQNVHITASFRRHAIPDKDPDTGMSLDSLAPAGKEQARSIGSTLEVGKSGLKIFGSGKTRAKETGALIAETAAGQADIINQQLENGKLEVKGKQELETAVLGPEAKRLIKEKGPDGFYQEWFERRDLGDGSTTPEMSAAALASRLDLYRQMSDLLKNDPTSELKILPTVQTPTRLLLKLPWLMTMRASRCQAGKN